MHIFIVNVALQTTLIAKCLQSWKIIVLVTFD